MKVALLVVAALAASTAVQAQNFQGPWVEARAGWDHVSDAGGNESGFLYGAAAGYDLALGSNGFVGLQAGISGASTETCFTGVCISAGRDIEVLARGGFAVAPRTALYALAGYSNARVNATALGQTFGGNADGYRLGAGVEQQFGSKTYGKVEYRYSNYGLVNFNNVGVADLGNRHQVSASFGVRF